MDQRRMAGRLAICSVLLVTALLPGCGVPFPTEAPPQRGPLGQGPGGRPQPLALNPRQELEVGRRAYREVRQKYEDQLVPGNQPGVQRARHVLSRLERAAAIEPLQREINLRISGYTFEWELNVIRDPQINAFSLPAGKIFVLTGILRIVGGNDDYLATVLSHEMAHVLAHHSSERVAQEHSAGGILRSLSYSRMQEAEADHIGIFLMTFAGYNPDAAVEFWKRMRAAHGEGGQVPEILSDHPSDASRVRQLRAWAPRARAAKEAFDEERIAPAR